MNTQTNHCTLVTFVLAFVIMMTNFVICQAQNKSTIAVKGTISDYLTNQAILDKEVTIERLSKDSTLISYTSSLTIKDWPPVKTRFFITLEEGEHIIRFHHERFQDLYYPITIDKSKSKEIDLGDIKLKRKLFNVLDEVDVVATKVKFYFDKDTLIYNVDAFVTQHGYVLNEILQKMPGLVIHPNGEIEVNGRKVDALLLNGKDFFNRDRKTLLANLPAFMIKKIEVYDKTKDSTSVIKREREFEGYVMDVKLKKEYNSIALGNGDIAYGTDNRYYAKLFGMKFDSFSRVSAYAIANNINKKESFSGNGDIVESSRNDNDNELSEFGLHYNYDHMRGLFSFKGDAIVSYTDRYSLTTQASQYFLEGGDLYNRNYMKSNLYEFSVSTKHDLYFLGNTKWDFSLLPTFQYERGNSNNFYINGAFSKDIDDLWGNAWVDSLRSMEQTQTMALYGITQSFNWGKYDRQAMRTGVDLNKEFKIPNSDDRINLMAKYVYHKTSTDQFSQQEVSYPNIVQTAWTNRYDDYDKHDDTEQLQLAYTFQISPNNTMTVSYDLNHSTLYNDQPTYALHKLAGWDTKTGGAIGLLPSQEELLNALDTDNSYSYTQRDNIQTVKAQYRIHIGNRSKKRTDFSITIPFTIERRELDFSQQNNDTSILRRKQTPTLIVDFSAMKTNENQTSLFYSFGYDYRVLMPTLFNLVNLKETRNTLMVSLGNPHLKDTRTHSWRGSFNTQNRRGYRHRVSMSYYLYQDNISFSRQYDRATGVTTIMPSNIDGNWWLDMGANNVLYVSPDRRSEFGSDLRVSWKNSVDHIGTDAESLAKKSAVLNFTIDERIRFRWSSSNTKLHADGSAYVNYSRSTSEREDFRPIDVYSYGLQGSISYELPKDFLIKSDILSVSRKGYNASDMNDQEYIWNANLTKKIGERYALSLECYDILNQRKSFYNYINAQGSTSSFYNNMRRYLMLHFTMRFDNKGLQNEHANHHH